jgi:hypothetical protein
MAGPFADAHPLHEQPVEGPTRWLLVAAAVGLMGLLVLARALEPDPRGYGTHTQLGLGPCAFATLTGHPCPTCGMTTSWAHFTRGDFGQAWRASPAGCLFAGFAPPLAVWLVLCSWLKKAVGFRSLDRPLLGLLAAVVLASLGFWFIRILGAGVR